MPSVQEGLAVRVGHVDPVVASQRRMALAVKTAESDFALQEELQMMRVHREMLREDVQDVLSPYEQMLRDIAGQVETRRIALLRNDALQTGSQNALSKLLSLRRSDPIMTDGEYTEQWFLNAEDGKPYPFEITYRAEGKGSVGEEGGRQVTPIRYVQLLRSGTDFPKRERRWNDISIELKDGKVDEVSMFVSRSMWQGQGTDLLASVETEEVKKVLDTSFVAPKADADLEKADAYGVSLWFSSLQGQEDGKPKDPGLVVRHHIDYGWVPKNFEYFFVPTDNHFRRRNDGKVRRDTYETERFTSLLQSTLRMIPATPIQIH